MRRSRMWTPLVRVESDLLRSRQSLLRLVELSLDVTREATTPDTLQAVARGPRAS